MSEVEITGIFDDVLGMIHSAKQKAEYQVNSTIIDLYQSIGEYVSKQVDVNGWGKSTVKALSEYILSKEPGIRGYSSQNIWRMKQFYETYKDKPEISKLLRENTWSNNLHIISKTKSYVKYEIVDEPPKADKDFNDFLCMRMEIYNKKTHERFQTKARST